MNNFIVTVVLLIIGSALFYINMKKESTLTSNSIVQNINAKQLKEIIKDNTSIQLVDVRTQLETKGGIIESAAHIDFFASDFADRFTDFDKEQPIYLYCRSGKRSRRAATILEKKGFTNVFNLVGGYSAW